MKPINITTKQKMNFMKKISFKANDKCWPWKGAVNIRGYGQFGIVHMMTQASRISWHIFNGPFDVKLLVLHHCDNPNCVNPKHLYLGDKFDNERDKIIRKRHANQKKETCPRGHKYDHFRTVKKPNSILGWSKRRCTICDKATDERARRRAGQKQRVLKASGSVQSNNK